MPTSCLRNHLMMKEMREARSPVGTDTVSALGKLAETMTPKKTTDQRPPMREEYDFTDTKPRAEIPALARLKAENYDKTRITINIDTDVLDAFRERAGGYARETIPPDDQRGHSPNRIRSLTPSRSAIFVTLCTSHPCLADALMHLLPTPPQGAILASRRAITQRGLPPAITRKLTRPHCPRFLAPLAQVRSRVNA